MDGEYCICNRHGDVVQIGPVTVIDAQQGIVRIEWTDTTTLRTGDHLSGIIYRPGDPFAFNLGTIVVHDGGTIVTSGDANHDDT